MNQPFRTLSLAVLLLASRSSTEAAPLYSVVGISDVEAFDAHTPETGGSLANLGQVTGREPHPSVPSPRFDEMSDIAAFDPGLDPVLGEEVGFPLVLPETPNGSVAVAAILEQEAIAALSPTQIAIPEPASLVMILTGLVGLWSRGKLLRKRIPAEAFWDEMGL